MKTTRYITKYFFLLLVTALFWAMPATTWGRTVTRTVIKKDFRYELNDSKMTASATGYSGFRKEITIPAVINDGGRDYTVTSIGEQAFISCTIPTFIEIPAGVTEIGKKAFQSCSNLETVVFAEGSKLEIIGENAFDSCASLTSIEIPAGVTEIGEGVFSGCTSLTSIEIPANVTQIGYEAFYDCTGLTSIIFAKESKLEKIGREAFGYCVSLTSIEIPASVTSIENFAFYECENLISVEIPAGVTEIGGYAFSRCPNLETVVFVEGSQLEYIGDFAFSGCTRLISIEIPASVTEIGMGAFENCTRLASVTFAIGSQLKRIGGFAFSGCARLISIEIPAGVTIEKEAFDSHTKVTWAGDDTWSGGTPAIGFNDPKISFDFIEGKLVLLFTGTLEGSEDGKQWTAINAISPYTVEMDGGKKFFRAVGVQDGSELGGTGSAGVGENFIIPLSETVNLEMIWVEPGTFKMGSPEDELGRRDDETQHQVTLTKGYWLGKYEVTQGQYKAVMGSNPSSFKGENLPVEMVSWEDATNFCAELTKTERAAGRLPEGYEYTLPTEAQWEYACRAGTTTALNSGRNLTNGYECFNLDEVGWYYYNSDRQTHPVGGKQPNTWGFYDMHGNVYEWCLDWYGDYPTGSVTDPTGPANGSYRVIRGGGWRYDAYGCRSASRNYRYPSGNNSYYGFRVALSPVQ